MVTQPCHGCPDSHACTHCHRLIPIRMQILSGDDTARLILLVHRHLHRARSPRHQRRCLGALKALLTLLGDLVCAPHALRHTVHILLQHLRIRSVLHLNT